MVLPWGSESTASQTFLLGDHDPLLDSVPSTWDPRIPCSNCPKTWASVGLFLQASRQTIYGKGDREWDVYSSWWGMNRVCNRIRDKGGISVGKGLAFIFLHPGPTNIWGRLVYEGRGLCPFCSFLYFQGLGQSLVSRRHLIHIC